MVNFAELQHQIDTNPTDEQCYETGKTHRAYGWAAKNIGKTDVQRAIYRQGFRGEPFNKDTNACESCVDDKCTTGPKCVILGRDGVEA
ncbi:hypothetical protein WK13_34500 [Burkholderia ubonensis]|uniref:hypothetical protein n=1 Tax=Burkholderia ubonensis TaxID=101571 RepID=UPI0007559006|nr:hypothetical protein [Burkholderia ubonensis]KVR21650.1 hypothetical protein WK13_34500 [Burkholderia ubonensis]